MKKASIAILVVILVASSGSAALAQTDAETIKAQIAALFAKIAVLQQNIKESEAPSFCYDFNSNIKFGDTGSVVWSLQTALMKSGLQIEAAENISETGPVFGESTGAAVVEFQQKHYIRPTGYVGSSTRDKLNLLYRCGIVQGSYDARPVLSQEEINTQNYIAYMLNAMAAALRDLLTRQ